MKKSFRILEERLNYTFQEKKLLKEALVHKSYGNENWSYKKINNERLELLGDAALDLVVVEYLYKNLVSAPEGELARLKSMLVSEPILSKIAMNLELGEYLKLGKGEELTGGRERVSILGDAFEAVMGAIYLDSSYETVRDVTLHCLKDYIEGIDSNEDIVDYKTKLQEIIQKKYKITPKYEVVSENGPDHSKIFEIIVKIENNSGIGNGKTKKIAEQKAAKELLRKIGEIS